MTIDDIVKTLQGGFRALLDSGRQGDLKAQEFNERGDFLGRLDAVKSWNVGKMNVKAVPNPGFATNADALIFRNTKTNPVILRLKFMRTAGIVPADPFFFIGPRSYFGDPGIFVGGVRRPGQYLPFDHMQDATFLVRHDEEVYAWKDAFGAGTGATGWIFWCVLDPESLWELMQPKTK